MSVATTWTPATHADSNAREGKDVVSADGEKVGSIPEILRWDLVMPAACGHHSFLLNPGLVKEGVGGLDKTYPPEATINEVSCDHVVLNLTVEQIRQRSQEWIRQTVGSSTERHA